MNGIGNIWLVSDLHLDHKAVIGYCNRPFANVEEMNERLIENINAVVKPGDRVFHLGDFAFARIARVAELLARLNGQWWLIKGNHDAKNWAAKPGDYAKLPPNVVKVLDYHELKIDGQKSVLCHYPMRSWNGSHHGSFMFHGHCHGDSVSYPRRTDAGRIADVGVDCWDYKPVPYEMLRDALITLPFSDHHSRDGD